MLKKRRLRAKKKIYVHRVLLIELTARASGSECALAAFLRNASICFNLCAFECVSFCVAAHICNLWCIMTSLRRWSDAHYTFIIHTYIYDSHNIIIIITQARINYH